MLCCGPLRLCCSPCSSMRPPSAPSCAGPGSGAHPCTHTPAAPRPPAVCCSGSACCTLPDIGCARRDSPTAGQDLRPKEQTPPGAAFLAPCPCRSRITPEKVRARRRALEELQDFTARSIADLKDQQDGEFLQGEAWVFLSFRTGSSCMVRRVCAGRQMQLHNQAAAPRAAPP